MISKQLTNLIGIKNILMVFIKVKLVYLKCEFNIYFI